MKKPETIDIDRAPGQRFQRFQDLMRFRVREILLVSSLYDSFIISEDGSLYESLLNEYLGLGLTHMPNVTRVTRGRDAERLAREPGRFDLVICSLRLDDMHGVEFARHLKQLGVDTPIVCLTYDTRELTEVLESGKTKFFDKVFVWQGDFRVFLAIIKYIEDRKNIAADTALVGVQSIIVIEDNVKFYSSFLPLIYTAVLEHTEELISEGINQAHKLLRMRARPKIILCSTYEEAWDYFKTYHENNIGVVSDVEFPRNGEIDEQAGFSLAKEIHDSHEDIPVLLQSSDLTVRDRAMDLGLSFLHKESATLLHDLESFMKGHFGFGDFIFRLSDGTVVGRATDLRTLEEQLRIVPDESIAYHGERNHFSTWLKARTEFQLAHELRPVKVTDFTDIGGMRARLINSLRAHRREQHRGSVVDFDPDTFDTVGTFARVGGGSLGGKARGLAFAHRLIDSYQLEGAIEGARVTVPPAIIIGTDVFDEFLAENELWDFAIRSRDDEAIMERFLEATFPEMVAEALNSFLERVKVPLSVRSSSLLEDSQFMPFAGVYETFMIPNNHVDQQVRLDELLEAVKRVYASTFHTGAKSYLKSTPYRLEEEKMAVIVQKLVGTRHDDHFYPDFSGVARSHNFYPIAPMEAADGIASVALGLGKQVVEGGATVRFCPRYPRHLVQFSSVADVLKYSQKTFFALELPSPEATENVTGEASVVQLALEDAEAHKVLNSVGSTYSLDNHAIYDGVSRPGPRVVTFAPILKNDLFPLPEILDTMLYFGRKGMSCHVEIEFAVNMSVSRGQRPEFHLLQMRPMVVEQEYERLSILETHRDDLICQSSGVLGNGLIRGIHDMVVVDVDRFDRSQSINVAREVAAINSQLLEKKVPYVLVGVGRWGSADPWLGIPVRWEDISGANVIVEAGMRDIRVTPSQGTHFFQNITSTKVGYITVGDNKNDFIDWEWLRSQPAERDEVFTRHIHFEEGLTVIMDGHHGHAVIVKPGIDPGTET